MEDHDFELDLMSNEEDDISLMDGSFLNVSREEEVHNNIFDCGICGKTYKYKRTLTRHMRVHATEAQYKCSLCILFFEEEAQLVQHKKDKHPSYLCVQCGKPFASKFSLERHQTVHGIASPSKMFKCLHPGCDKTFVRKDSRDDHTNTHGNLLPHECINCGKRFNNRNNMKAHVKVCVGEKEHRCNICGLKYSRSAELWQHVRAVHQKVELHCPKCGKAIMYKPNISRHLKNCKGN